MKRINLSVDIDDNVIFEEAVLAAMKSQARQLSREKVSEELSKEIDRQIKEALDDKLKDVRGESWYTSYSERIEKSIESQLLERLYKDIGEQVTFNLKKTFAEKFGLRESYSCETKNESEGGKNGQ